MADLDTRPEMLRTIETNYSEAFNFLLPRKQRQVNQLVLLNNLQRGDENIASTLLLTLFDRIMSSLYDDKIQIKFLPSQGILQEQLNSYNILAQSDYMEMDKSVLDYDWIWDTLFFGRGYIETLKFNKKRKIMEPEVINPLVFGYDPYFDNKDDWRYYWKWLTKSKFQLESLMKSGQITGINSLDEIPSGIDPYLWQFKTKRDQAKKVAEPSLSPRKQEVYQILEYFGYDENGEKCIFWTDKSFSKVLRKEKLQLQNGPDDQTRWPIVIKQVFKEPHSTVNFSVADLLEDKHRAKSVLLNLAFIAAKDKANPLYWYNENVKDVTQLFSRQVSQHIPLIGNSTGTNSIGPLNTEEPMSAGLLQFIRIMEGEAEAPVGAGRPMQAQGATAKATATEAALDQQLNDLSQSLQSKVMAFGEKDFWSQWFHLYANRSETLGEKIANIVGVKGINSTTVSFKDFNTDFPPGVMVYSAKEAEYKELVLRRDMMQLYPELSQTLDADGMRNFNKFIFFPKFLQDPSLIDIMLPKTIDEIRAEGENEQLTEDKMPDVSPTDNHTTHIYTHMMVQPKTKATWFHIEWHQELLAQQKAQEQAQAQMQAQQAGPAQPGQQPAAGAVPLKGAMASPNNNLAANTQSQ